MKDGSDLTSSVILRRHVRNRLVSGVFILVPLALTFFFLNLLFKSFTGFTRPLLRLYLVNLPPYVLTALSVATALLIVYTVGLVASHIAGHRLIRFGESLMMKLPLIKSIYGASRQVVNTFSSSGTSAFQAVVTVEFPREGSLAIGFVTGSILDPKGQLLYCVVVPTAPNPTTAYLLFLPAQEVRFTDIAVEQGIKMLISGGMLSPAQYGETQPLPIALATCQGSRTSQPDGRDMSC